MKTEFYSTITDGKMQRNTARNIAEFVKQFEGKRIIISIEKLKSTRSSRHNRYIHLLFTIFTKELNELGNEFHMEEIKELCKTKFSTIDVINKDTGEIIGQRIKGTHEMGKGEMVEFIDNIIRWAADMFHIVLPFPSEQLNIEL